MIVQYFRRRFTLGRLLLIVFLPVILCVAARAQNTEPTDQPQKVGPEIHAPVPLTTPEAEMPDEARRKQQNGICLISIIVDSYGVPNHPRVVRCSDPMFAKNSTDAVLKYRFKPAFRISDGKAVPVILSVEINFRFGNGSTSPEEPPTRIRYGFLSPPGMISTDPDQQGIYPLSKLLEKPRMTEFANKGFGTAALPFPDGTACNLMLTLSQKGKPLDASVIDCDKPVLEKPAIDSVMKSKYKPAKLNGNPVTVRMIVHLAYDGFGPHKDDDSSTSKTPSKP